METKTGSRLKWKEKQEHQEVQGRRQQKQQEEEKNLDDDVDFFAEQTSQTISTPLFFGNETFSHQCECLEQLGIRGGKFDPI